MTLKPPPAAEISERLTDEQLRDWRDEAEIGAMMSPFETLSVLDALVALRARVAKLEAALKQLHDYAASVWFDEARTSDEEIELMANARAALKDAPQ